MVFIKGRVVAPNGSYVSVGPKGVPLLEGQGV